MYLLAGISVITQKNTGPKLSKHTKMQKANTTQGGNKNTSVNAYAWTA